MGKRAKPMFINCLRTDWRNIDKLRRDLGQQTRRQTKQRYRHPKVIIVMRYYYECKVNTKEKPHPWTESSVKSRRDEIRVKFNRDYKIGPTLLNHYY